MPASDVVAGKLLLRQLLYGNVANIVEEIQEAPQSARRG